MTLLMIGGNLVLTLYLVWRAKDSHWHSKAEWQLLREIQADLDLIRYHKECR